MGSAIAFLLLVVYAAGIVYISKRTKDNLTGSSRWLVILLWPIFLIASPRFRRKLD